MIYNRIMSKYDPLKPSDKIRAIKKHNLLLINELMKLNLKTIDKAHMAIMSNPFCVYAAPYSIKSSGNIVLPIEKGRFIKENIYAILHASEPKGNESNVAPMTAGKPAVPQPYRRRDRAGIRFPSSSFRFIDNNVRGLKDHYITVLKHHKKRFKLSLLKTLQKCSNLSDFYIMECGNYVYSYNLKIHQFGRVVKIMRKARSANLGLFMTRRHAPLLISDVRYDDGSVDRLNYLGTLKSEHGFNDTHSRPHCNFFGVHYDNLAGSGKLNEGEMTIE